MAMQEKGGLFQWWLDKAPGFGVGNLTGKGGVAGMRQRRFVFCVVRVESSWVCLAAIQKATLELLYRPPGTKLVYHTWSVIDHFNLFSSSSVVSSDFLAATSALRSLMASSTCHMALSSSTSSCGKSRA